MMKTETAYKGIDPDAAGRFRLFAEALLAADSDTGRIHSLHVTGSAVAGEYVAGKSDVNSIVVLHAMDLRFLEMMAPLGKRFGRKRVASPLVMTPEYIESSLDVFPIEFLNIRLVHRTVSGFDLFESIRIDTGDLRLQCERDLKAKLIGLRQGYLSSQGDARILNEDFSRGIAGYIPLFRAIVQLHGEDPAVAYREVVGQLGRVTGVDTAPYVKAIEKRSGRGRSDLDELKRLFETYYAATEALGEAIDGLDG